MSQVVHQRLHYPWNFFSLCLSLILWHLMLQNFGYCKQNAKFCHTPFQESLDASHLEEVNIRRCMILRYCLGRIYQKKIIWTKARSRRQLITFMKSFSNWRIWWRQRYWNRILELEFLHRWLTILWFFLMRQYMHEIRLFILTLSI